MGVPPRSVEGWRLAWRLVPPAHMAPADLVQADLSCRPLSDLQRCLPVALPVNSERTVFFRSAPAKALTDRIQSGVFEAAEHHSVQVGAATERGPVPLQPCGHEAFDMHAASNDLASRGNGKTSLAV